MRIRSLPRLAVLVCATLAAGTVVAITPSASATSSASVCADEPNGGVVVHDADAKLVIASLSDSCDDKCTVADPVSKNFWWGWKVGGGERVGCDWKDGFRDGGTSSRTIMQDVDAFTFPNTEWYYNGRRIGQGVYVKIRDLQRVLCTRVTGFAPRCAG